MANYADIQTRPVRGLQAVKTAVAQQGAKAKRTQLYTRVLTLEIERDRRLKEREQARRRFEDATVRLQRIDAELLALKALLDGKEIAQPEPASQIVESRGQSHVVEEPVAEEPEPKKNVVRHRY